MEMASKQLLLRAKATRQRLVLGRKSVIPPPLPNLVCGLWTLSV